MTLKKNSYFLLRYKCLNIILNGEDKRGGRVLKGNSLNLGTLEIIIFRLKDQTEGINNVSNFFK